jgi:glycosyltransferase involved in cell wall biosynthesis
VTLEALASGVPTVAFDTGAAREHLRHSVQGAAIAPDAAWRDRDFIDAATRIAADDALRQAMRARCREAVQALRPARVAEDFDRMLAALATNHGDIALAAR